MYNRYVLILLAFLLPPLAVLLVRKQPMHAISCTVPMFFFGWFFGIPYALIEVFYYEYKKKNGKVNSSPANRKH
ncbi:YqaE/Pmp3 family membrane protein [Paenibacillus zeirhizosphaerae]|uniref:YqaE/Pmp3 family membrane protein n=1 Tax=Paenibacillus zeirhizosphaerae TaxID=2987519 RepID=UPI003520535B